MSRRNRPHQAPARHKAYHRSAQPATKAAVAALMLLIISLGSASPAAAETKVSVTTPSGDLYVEGKPIYLIVTVSPDQAIEGTITVDNDQGVDVATQQFEAAGGVTKEILVRVPVIEYGLNVRVKTSDGGNRKIRPNFQLIQNEQPVGLSPGLVSPSNPRTVTMKGGSQLAALYPFDPSWLDYGPEILGHHNALAMAEVDFDALSETQRQSLYFWVTRGGSFIIDSPVDSPPIGLPVSLGRGSRASFGVGAISLSGGSAAAGDFDGLFSSRLLQSGTSFGPGYNNSPITAIAQLIDDAVIPKVPVNLLAPLMGVYVLVIGPGAWLWLRRREGLPKVWVVVPAIAILSTVGIWAVGAFLRGASSGAHVTLVADYAGLSEIRSQYIVSTASGGFTGIRLEEGWEQDSVFGQSYDPYSGESFTEAIRQEDEVGTNLTPGSSAVAGASRIGPNEPSWQVEVSRSGTSLSGSITNLSNYRLEDVVIAISDGVEVVPAIDQGQTVDFTLKGSAAQGNVHSRVTGRLESNSGEDESSSPGIYEQWSSSVPNSQTGHLVVVGWSDELDGPLASTNGDTFDVGRTGFVSMVKLPPETLASQIGVLIATGQQFYGEEELVDGRGRFYAELVASYQFELTKELGQNQVVIDFDSSMAAADIWDGKKWISSGLATADIDTDERHAVAISPDLIVDGVVTFRAGVSPDDPGFYDEGYKVEAPEVRFAKAGEKLIIVEAAG